MSRRSARPLARGMTLIEVIVTIAVLGLVGSMLFQYYFAGQKTSSLPLTRLDGSLKLNAAMANIASDWSKDACCNGGDAASMAALQTRVNNFSANYGAACSTCTATTSTPASFGGITIAGRVLVVTVTNSATGQSITNVFAVKQ